MGEIPFDHLMEGVGDKYAFKAAMSELVAPVVPKPRNTVGVPWAATRDSPPK